MRIVRWAFTILLLTPLTASLLAGVAHAQDQDNSLAAAARRALEQKKEQPKAAKVWDNSNLPTSAPVSVVGQEPAANGSGATDTTNSTTLAADAKPAPTAAEMAQLNSELDAAKQRMADLKADLDVAQRKYALDQQTYYGKPNFLADKAGAAALAAEKSDIDAKADAVAAAEKLLASAQAKADEAGKAAKAAQDKSVQDQAAQNQATNPTPPAPKPPAISDSVTVNPH
ncbi:MAG: hypothetical protein WCC21_19530 [Candidatus Acidiferrales bacterium]